MKKLLSLFIATVMSVAVCSQTIIPEGDISGTWTLSGSPYQITGTTTVPDGSTLTIEAGVTVEWQGSYTMWIEGRILAMGTAADTVLFTAADPLVGFRSIRFDTTNSANDTSRFEYCIFEYGNVYGDYPDNCGGAIGVVYFSELIVDHCLFRYNFAIEPNVYPTNAGGGAIALLGSSPQIRNCTFISNEAYVGGAIAYATGSNPLIENNTFEGNTAIGTEYGEAFGGAVLCYSESNGIVSNNTFRDNTAIAGGGGIAVIDNCNPIIHHNLLYNNSAEWGGAICEQWTCRVTLTNNTIADNLGGGVYLFSACNVEIMNTILWENSPYQIYLEESTDTVSAYYSDVMGGQSAVGGWGFIDRWSECIDEDPLFEESDTCYYCLTEVSPCIDADNPFCTDPDGTTCDMGACWCNYLHIGMTEFQVSDGRLNLEIYPNPARRIVNCQLSIVDFQRITVKIYNTYGQEIRILMDEEKSAGEYLISGDVSGLPAGIYLVKLQAANKMTAVKLCIQ